MPYLPAPHAAPSLFYRDHGDGPAVVFLASQGLSSHMWQTPMARLTVRGFRCVALDRRGHGRSDDPGRGLDMEQTSLLALLACSRSVVSTDFRAELPRLNLPALVIHETADASNPIELTGARTARLVPGAQFKVYDNASHGLVVTHLPQFEADLTNFMKTGLRRPLRNRPVVTPGRARPGKPGLARLRSRNSAPSGARSISGPSVGGWSGAGPRPRDDRLRPGPRPSPTRTPPAHRR